MFMNANLFLGSVIVWHSKEDDSYHIDTLVHAPTERVNVNRIFDSISVPIPLECVLDLLT